MKVIRNQAVQILNERERNRAVNAFGRNVSGDKGNFGCQRDKTARYRKWDEGDGIEVGWGGMERGGNRDRSEGRDKKGGKSGGVKLLEVRAVGAASGSLVNALLGRGRRLGGGGGL